MQPLGADATEDPPLDAMCAGHPTQRASIACPFCGDFACASCTADTDWGDTLCEPCLQRGRAQYPLPWEQSATPASYVHSAYLVLTDTRSLFSALPQGGIARASAFALSSAAITGAVALLIAWLFAGGHWSEGAPDARVLLLSSLLAQPLSLLSLLVAVAACFHAGATLLGGRAAFACAARATCYLSVLAVLEAASKLIDTIATGGALGLLRVLAMIALACTCGVRALAIVGERRYGLSHRRALLVAAAALLAPLVAAHVALAAMTYAAAQRAN